MQQLRASLPARCGTLRSVKRNRCVRTMAAVNVQQLKKAKEQIRDIITGAHCNPILVRLGWHDSGTYSKDAGGWPKAGGATASIRFNPELGHGANAGLSAAIALLEPVKVACPDVSYADLFQLASATAIELAGGPQMAMRYGRKDAPSCEDCTPDGRLPAAAHPFPDGSTGPGDHLRRVFYRMGLDDKDIVVLSGAHTLGRARPERSGFGKESTRYTKDGPGKPGGSSWTVDWLVFNNDYFKEVRDKRDADLLVLETDAVLFEDDGFRPYAEKYAADEAAFFSDYAVAHVKLSELGVAWEQGGPVTLD